MTLADRAARDDPVLSDILANRRWWRYQQPFPYYVAPNVFTSEVYESLVIAFHAVLAGRSGYLARHDIYGTTFEPGLTGPLRLFVSRSWHDMIAGLFGVAATGHMSGGTHHHEPGSSHGFPHNDLNPGWFIDDKNEDGIVLPQQALCHYQTGPTVPGETARRVIRAVAVLYYLDNLPWQRGDGGETYLYTSASDPVVSPVARIAPRNNMMLVFERTPYSFHAFASNCVHPPQQHCDLGAPRAGGRRGALGPRRRPGIHRSAGLWSQDMRRVCLITGAGGVLGTAFRRRHAGEYDVAAIIRSRPVWVPSQDKHIVDPLDPGRMIDAGATQVHEIRVDLMSQASPGQPAREVADRIVDIDRGDGTGDVLLMETGP